MDIKGRPLKQCMLIFLVCYSFSQFSYIGMVEDSNIKIDVKKFYFNHDYS